MSSPLLLCPRDGLFPASAISVNDASLTLGGNMMTCPACGELAPILDGTYTVRDGEMTATLRLTPAQQEHLQRIAQYARKQSEVRPAEDVLAEVAPQVEDVSPGLFKRIFNAAGDPRVVGMSTLAGTLFSALALLGATEQPELSSDEIQQIVREVVEQSSEDTGLKTPRTERTTSAPTTNPTDE